MSASRSTDRGTSRGLIVLAFVGVCLCPCQAAVPKVTEMGGRTVVEGTAYRVGFATDAADITYELRAADGNWYAVTRSPAGLVFGLLKAEELFAANSVRTRWTVRPAAETVTVGGQVVLDPAAGVILDLHFVCAADGVLVGSSLRQRSGEPLSGAFWSPPRLTLAPADWDTFGFWDAGGRLHSGRIAALDPCPAYAGVSAWGPQGDTVERLSSELPGLTVRSTSRGICLAVVYVEYPGTWQGARMFVQRHTPAALYLYAGYNTSGHQTRRWAWLAPLPGADADDAGRVRHLAASGPALLAGFQPVSTPPPESATRPIPDFPSELRHATPVQDLNEAVVFTVNEDVLGPYGVELARKVGSDVLIRAWFKWGQAPRLAERQSLPGEVHKLGAWFGGGITCSALYDNENGLTRDQVLDLATRGPAGQLIDAWDTPGIRHGSLSSPAYLDYLCRWCREQIDAGADYLFMDEHTAAIGGLEGYDDHSLVDFRSYLIRECPQTREWTPRDPRWQDELGVDLSLPDVCPSGAMDSFDYRAFLRRHGWLEKPTVPANRLAACWGQFRSWRDDRAWKTLTDRIRAYAKEKGRTVLISANGLARYVDLQVLGVWGKWTTRDGNLDLRENQLAYWRSLVTRGHDLAGSRVPVVLFHDWGFGEPPFPWLAVPASQREVWMRTRGAEIYAAGAFFAFPVLGPFGCDALRDGSLTEIARQTVFYQSHRELYLRSRWLGCDRLRSTVDNLSLAAWWQPAANTVLVHVINRNVVDGRLVPVAREVAVQLPLAELPTEADAISPDFGGPRPVTCRRDQEGIQVVLPGLEAYSIARLRYTAETDFSRLGDPVRIRPESHWARPARSEFRVRPDGTVENDSDLEGFLQGMLHTHLRNPPTFLVNATEPGRMLVHVRAVSAAGARLEYRVDGELQQTVDLPDRDGKNDGVAPEYDTTYTFAVPAGSHRLGLDNTGGDWAVIEWYEFQGRFGQ